MENNLQELVFKYRWYLTSISIGIIILVLGLVSLTKYLPFLDDNKIEILNSETENKEAIIEISGAVEKPGVYKLNTGNRIEDALIASGGLSANADRDWVAKTINRAAKLTDGQKIYIPEKSSTSNSSKAGISGDVQGISSGLININNASQKLLEELPGIGPVTAQKIIDNRPYSAVEELITRKILKQKVYEDIKNKLSIY